MTRPRPPLPDSDPWSIFLDVDGTLIEIADRPDRVVVPEKLGDLLRRLCVANSGALALVSGRPVSEIDSLFHPQKLPVAGQHGLEIRLPGQDLKSEQPIMDESIRSLVDGFRETYQNVVTEDKGGSLAFHFRQNPRAEAAAMETAEKITDELGKGYTIQKGKMVVEVKPRSAHKGAAIATILRHDIFAGRIPVFVGDDTTDEDGFDTVNEMDGVSVHVGADAETSAVFSLKTVGEVHDWLESVTTKLERAHG